MLRCRVADTSRLVDMTPLFLAVSISSLCYVITPHHFQWTRSFRAHYNIT